MVVEQDSAAKSEGRKTKSKPEMSSLQFNYPTASLSLGLLLKPADDAAREGDRERITLCWRFFLLYFNVFNYHKYAMETFLLLSQATATLTEWQTHCLTWNRTTGNKAGKGKNILNGVRLENWNCLTKELLGHVCVNLNERCAMRERCAMCESCAIHFVEELMLAIDDDIMLSRPSVKHTVQKREK